MSCSLLVVLQIFDYSRQRYISLNISPFYRVTGLYYSDIQSKRHMRLD